MEPCMSSKWEEAGGSGAASQGLQGPFCKQRYPLGAWLPCSLLPTKGSYACVPRAYFPGGGAFSRLLEKVKYLRFPLTHCQQNALTFKQA